MICYNSMKKNSKNGKITLGGLADKIDKVSDNLDTLAIMTAKGFSDVDKKFGQIDQRFEQMDHRFEQADKKQDDVISRVGKVEDKVDNLDYKLFELTAKVDNIEVSLDKEVKHVKSRVGILERAVLNK